MFRSAFYGDREVPSSTLRLLPVKTANPFAKPSSASDLQNQRSGNSGTFSLPSSFTPGTGATKVNQNQGGWGDPGTWSGAAFDNLIWDRNASTASNLMGWGSTIGMSLIPGLGWAGLAGRAGLRGAQMALRAKKLYNAARTAGKLRGGVQAAMRQSPLAAKTFLGRAGALAGDAARGSANAVLGYQAGLGAGALAGAGANALGWQGNTSNTVGEPTWKDRATDMRTMATAPLNRFMVKGLADMGRMGSGLLGHTPGLRGVMSQINQGRPLKFMQNAGTGWLGQVPGFRSAASWSRRWQPMRWSTAQRALDKASGSGLKGTAAQIGLTSAVETGLGPALEAYVPDQASVAIDRLADQYNIRPEDRQAFRERVKGTGNIKRNWLTQQYQGLRNHTDTGGSPIVSLDLEGLKRNDGRTYIQPQTVDLTDALANQMKMDVPEYRSFQDQFNRTPLEYQQFLKDHYGQTWDRYEQSKLQNGEYVGLGEMIQNGRGQKTMPFVRADNVDGQIVQRPYYQTEVQGAPVEVPGFHDPAYEQQRTMYNDLNRLAASSPNGTSTPVPQGLWQYVQPSASGGYEMQVMLNGSPVVIPLDLRQPI